MRDGDPEEHRRPRTWTINQREDANGRRYRRDATPKQRNEKVHRVSPQDRHKKGEETRRALGRDTRTTACLLHEFALSPETTKAARERVVALDPGGGAQTPLANAIGAMPFLASRSQASGRASEPYVDNLSN